VLICYGVTNSVASFSTGYLVKLTGRFLMVLSATVIQIGITVTLYVWTPDPANSPAVFFIISGLWGITDAVWLVQINGESQSRGPTLRLIRIVGDDVFSYLRFSWFFFLCRKCIKVVLTGVTNPLCRTCKRKRE
jgi:hypothetical protein